MIRCLLVVAAMTFAAPSLSDTPPRIAIIIDDLGYEWEAGLETLALPADLTVAILPHAPRSRHLAEAAYESGKEVIVHLPLQAMNHTGPVEPGRITMDMSEDQLATELDRALESVPYAVGVNNHRGSLLTRHPGHMQWLMQRIAETGELFFVDSFTTHHSIAMSIARETGVPSARRDVFLDWSRDPDEIRHQLDRLRARAERQGEAVAIGHPYPETLAALAEVLPKLLEEGFELVPVSEIVRLN